jgi:hypothetical protein
LVSCWDERRFDGGEPFIIWSGTGRLRSLGDELITLRVGVDDNELATDRGGEIGFFLKRL